MVVGPLASNGRRWRPLLQGRHRFPCGRFCNVYRQGDVDASWGIFGYAAGRSNMLRALGNVIARTNRTSGRAPMSLRRKFATIAGAASLLPGRRTGSRRRRRWTGKESDDAHVAHDGQLHWKFVCKGDVDIPEGSVRRRRRPVRADEELPFVSVFARAVHPGCGCRMRVASMSAFLTARAMGCSRIEAL
jgi:hypothetical protein